MSNTKVNAYVERIEAIGKCYRDELTALEPVELTYGVDHAKFYTVRRMLLLATTHVQEHITQLLAARADTDADPTMPQRMLARAMSAQGDLLAAMTGLEDEELDKVPQPGEWSAREVIEHVIQVQEWILKNIQEAREKAEVSEQQ